MEAFHPVGLNVPPGVTDEWWVGVWSAWRASATGDVTGARQLYEDADAAISGQSLNASLSVLRHNVGVGSGSVVPVPATERDVVSLFLPPHCNPDEISHKNALGGITEDHLRWFIENIQSGHHAENIERPREHVMVLSTGRCGTMSLYKLFGGSNLEPYHTYWFMTHPCSRSEMVCRLHANNFDNLRVPAEWATTRAAEWLGEKPMIGLNHSDTVYAPVFAAIHSKSKFVYLRRDPEKVFKSFYEKKQWNGGANHFYRVRYDFDGGYKFSVPSESEADGIRWHINYTEEFSHAFGRVMGDRFIEISSDKLFAQDEDEINRLLEFTGSDIPLDQAKEHFTHKINEKKHKIVPTENSDESMQAMLTS